MRPTESTEVVMKKVLSFSLVLVCAVNVQAAITMSLSTTELEVGQTLTVSIISDSGSSYGVWLCVDEPSLGQWRYSPPGIWESAGADAAIGPWPYGACLLLEARSFDPTHPVLPGVHFTVDYQALAVGDSTISLWDFDASTRLQQATIHQTPEPATMTLLVLAVPALRRQRRR